MAWKKVLFAETLVFLAAALLTLGGDVFSVSRAGAATLAPMALSQDRQIDRIVRREAARVVWAQRALSLQAHLDLDAPLAAVTWPHTHNSFNSRAYARWGRYIDPNQLLTIAEQLRWGIRSVEFDVHWAWSARPGHKWEKALLLCHANKNNLFCDPFDRTLAEGLAEVRRFLAAPENRHEVLVLYIEDFMHQRSDLALRAIADSIAPYIYRPEPGEKPCVGIPMDITKRQILAAGKNLLLMGGHAVCGNPEPWRTWAYAGVGDFTNDSYPTADIAAYRRAGCDAVFDRGFQHSHWLRVQEDRTKVSTVLRKARTLSMDDIHLLTRCGVNLIGFDQLRAGDPRLAALVWSWQEFYPSARPGDDCAAQQGNGRWVNRNCAEEHAFACRLPDGGWEVSTRHGPWYQGQEECARLGAGQARFSLPVNGRESEALRRQSATADTSPVWVHYQAVSGEWVAGF